MVIETISNDQKIFQKFQFLEPIYKKWNILPVTCPCRGYRIIQEYELLIEAILGQVMMMTFGAGIGTGLWVGTGQALAHAGPAGIAVAYTITA